MKKSKRLLVGMCGVCVAVTVLGVMVGCEQTERQMALQVTPESSQVSGQGQTVLLTAALEGATPTAITNSPNEIFYPLVWDVSNKSHGEIISAVGDTAVYRCKVEGKGNVVTVHDQAWRAGQAVIEWEAEEIVK